MTEKLTLPEAIQKLEYYCAYQERCHQEVTDKLYQLGVTSEMADAVIVHLIEHHYLNEERFARSFARGKFSVKHWGKNRIVSELKWRHISAPNIKAALSEIDEDEYQAVFDQLAEKHWHSLTEHKGPKKNKKFCDYLLRRGWESDWVYAKMKELES